MGQEAPGITTSPPSTLVRVVTGHVVSSNSMVSRAYLKDSWRGIVAADAGGGHWLVCTLDALAPDEEGLLIRGEAEGGPPRAYAKATLTKIVVSWAATAGQAADDEEITLANPRVVRHPRGASIGVVFLDRNREYARQLQDGKSPAIHVIATDGTGSDRALSLDDTPFDVDVLLAQNDGPAWPVRRRAWLSGISGDGFLGQPGTRALDLALAAADSGSPAFVHETPDSAMLAGVVRPVGAHVAMLLPASLIAETIAHAREGDGPR